MHVVFANPEDERRWLEEQIGKAGPSPKQQKPFGNFTKPLPSKFKPGTADWWLEKEGAGWIG